ncbi:MULTISPECIES: esterase/lipase family protein [unclassified Coleofasciculus]|uniref:esterase/lipase family protein n=1 Tax=unclassified Coleofasciculus TaxID=2692782 RepID=UPI00188157A7|nr:MULTISPECIES: alpha/beta hydrolase [unclassified Coleofasciculus]MBE9127379.1 alpha/beta hydrolase [Coleofasciculus sp. LEGE 07081]MBE9147355.1 alpha/beta hydrolase [Coleofasciculus sp. LEGE 07092]
MPLPTVILPGFFAGATEYRALEQSLQELGFPTVTVPLQQRDWFPTVGGRSIVPILRTIDQTVKGMLEEYNVSQVNLIGHSAGGWIARIYLGEKPYIIHGDVTESTVGLWHAHPDVATLVTLGTPHISQERWTKRNLDFVKIHYPGAFYPQVRYVCVAGKAIYGKRRLGQWLAYNSYKLTCGEGNCWGDGITPIDAAHLEGATNLTLEGVLHSPRRVGLWYGSPESMESWVSYLI